MKPTDLRGKVTNKKTMDMDFRIDIRLINSEYYIKRINYDCHANKTKSKYSCTLQNI